MTIDVHAFKRQPEASERWDKLDFQALQHNFVCNIPLF